MKSAEYDSLPEEVKAYISRLENAYNAWHKTLADSRRTLLKSHAEASNALVKDHCANKLKELDSLIEKTTAEGIHFDDADTL